MEGDLAMLARSIENSLPLGSLGFCIYSVGLVLQIAAEKY